MQNYTTSYQQNVCDVCLIVYGTLDKLVKLMFDNGLSFGTSIPSGTVLQYDDGVQPSRLRFSTGW